MKHLKILLFVFLFLILLLLPACDFCDHEYVETIIHSTCTVDGKIINTCKYCGDTSEEILPAYGHSFKDEKKENTCTEFGYTKHSCPCGYSYISSISSASGHDYRETVQAPTCNDKGFTLFDCRNCDHTYKDHFIEPTGHKITTNNVNSPTCTEEGYTDFICINNNCDYRYVSDYVKPSGHLLVETITAPTCTEEGYTTSDCQICDYSFKSKYVSPTGHNFTEEVVIAASCLKEGETVYSCDCGYSYSYITAPTGHTLKKEFKTTANCTQSGETVYSCDCGFSYSEILPPLGHNFKTKVIHPTVSDMGYTEFSCDCGFNYKGNYRFYSEILDNAYAGDDKVLAHGIDISSHNGTIDLNSWKALKEAGVDFVILKIGSTIRDDGKAGGIDPTFEANYEGAKAAGIDVGVYFFTYSSSVDEIREDATNVLKWLEGKQFEYPIYLDIENTDDGSYKPSEIASHILTEMCLTFFSTLQKEGYYTGLYVNNSFLFEIMQTENMIELFEIWYTRPPSLDPLEWNPDDLESRVWDTEKYGEHLGMWQYCQSGSLPPIATVVDFNYAYKDYPTLIKSYGFNGFSLEDDEKIETENTES